MSEVKLKKDGTPAKTRGRKPGSTNGSRKRSLYIWNGSPLGRARPSLDVIKSRTKVTIPFGESYDQRVHGVGSRDPNDDIRYERMVQNKQSKTAKANFGVQIEKLEPVV